MSKIKFDIESVLENSAAEIQRAAATELQQQVISAIKWNMSDQINKYAQTFFEENILPDIKAALHEDKELIISSAMEGIKGIGEEVGNALKTQAAEKIKNSWNVRKISEALFN